MNVDTVTDAIITVDYGKSLEAMIRAGNYDWVNPNITPKRFFCSIGGIEQFETRVFHFGSYISSEDAVKAIKTNDWQNPWQLASIEALLAFGANNPEEQRNYPIVGLGSVARVYGSRLMPCLHGDDAQRRLGLSWWVADWNGWHRFLAVRKSLPLAA